MENTDHVPYNSFLLFDETVIEECNKVILPADSIQSIKKNQGPYL